MLERCEVCPFWLTEKAQKYQVKAKSSEKPTLEDDPVSQRYKISQSNIFMRKAHS